MSYSVESESAQAKGFNLSRLQPNTRICLKTSRSSYEIQYLGGKDGLITGGNLAGGGIRFPRPTRIVIHGSLDADFVIRHDWVYEGMRLDFYDLESNATVITSPIANAVLIAPDGSWSYSMEWRTD